MSDSSKWLLGGGIGSGKSSVRRLLEGLGVETVDADSIGHQVLEPDGPVFADVAARWPATVVDGRIDRSKLASIVFSDPEELSDLEQLTHPHIFDRIEGLGDASVGVVVVEIPLLRTAPPGEWGRIVVDCEDAIRLERLIGRGLTAEDAQARMKTQPSRAEWLAVADLVVPNHASLEELGETVVSLVPWLLRVGLTSSTDRELRLPPFPDRISP